MHKHLKRIAVISTSVISAIFTIIPESFFESIELLGMASEEINIISNRIVFALLVIVIISILYALTAKMRKGILIKGANYSIKVSYGNILRTKNAKIVVPFDECYTTSVGERPEQIKASSICGQYLNQNINSRFEMQQLIDNSMVKPSKRKSSYNNQVCYTPGTIVPDGRYLLLAFAKLNRHGLCHMSYKEYTDCLNILWEEINKHYGQKNVCIPILGSGITRFDDTTLTQQELLDIIICSYKLSPYKLKSPAKLHIVCKRQDGFSLNDIDA